MRFESIIVLAVATLATATGHRGSFSREKLARRDTLARPNAEDVQKATAVAINNMVNTASLGPIKPSQFITEMVSSPNDNNVTVVVTVCNLNTDESSTTGEPADEGTIRSLSLNGHGNGTSYASSFDFDINMRSKTIGNLQYLIGTTANMDQYGTACGAYAIY